MTTWNKTAEKLPTELHSVLVCHYEDDVAGNNMYKAVAFYDDGLWYSDVGAQEVYTPKYWMELPRNPE